MIISFQKTQPEFVNLSKFVTRRIWKPRTINQFKAGSFHKAWNKTPYATGGLTKPARLGTIKALKDAYAEPLGEITLAELRAEGGKWRNENEFFLEFVKDIEKELPNLEVSVARFVPISLYYAAEAREVPVNQTAIYLKKTLELFAGYELDFRDNRQFEFFDEQLKIFQKTVSTDPAAAIFDPVVDRRDQNSIDWFANMQLYYFGTKDWLQYAAENAGKMPDLLPKHNK